MAGTKIGGQKAAAKNLARNPNFYSEVGRRGGLAGSGKNYRGGFAHPNADPVAAGRKGGKASRRPRKKATA